ncbi:hypothetical protein AST07_08270 [Staphylococcus saprophyticus]|nr:triacylglycerol lipase [Staphylococcus saprophyticus]OEK91391.1 hypothetical protein AST07_08270 [Staphylococcus saprophyticus]
MEVETQEDSTETSNAKNEKVDDQADVKANPTSSEDKAKPETAPDINSKEDTKNEQQDQQSLTEDETTQEPQRIENNGDKNNLKTKTKFDTEKVDLDPNAKDSPYKAKDKVENETATPRKRADAEEVEADKLLKDSKTAKQGEYKNKYPLILVHGFFGGVGENRPVFYPNYWGGDKFHIKEQFEKSGYEVHEATVGTFSSNHDRATELYYYIKGGRVDYGQAHAEKYGHDRYGRTYTGVMPEWQPGQKVHLVGHSMGGQMIRLLEHYLRFGNQEEIDYQKEHGGEISPLFEGNHDNMISSMTTLGATHNGTQGSDKLGVRQFARDIINTIGKVGGNKFSTVDLGFVQWGFHQRANESYIEYSKRIKNSPLWDTKDNALTDLTAEGSEQLNQNTSLNPNIVYTSYAGEASHATLSGKHVPNIRQYPLMDLTSRIIGKDKNHQLRLNDGIVPTISVLYPNGQAYKNVTDISSANEKGIWQVLPVKKDWDHMDFVGMDPTDYKRTGEELEQFYTGIVDHLMRVEESENRNLAV